MIGLQISLVVVAGATVFLLTMLCFSLRDFSRSRLERICKRHKRLDRFGDILQAHEKSLLICETALLVLVVTLTWRSTQSSYFDIFDFPATADLPMVLAWIGRLVAGVIFVSLSFVILPWTVSRVRGEALLFRIWPVLRFAGQILSPVWRFAVHLDRIVHRIFAMPEPNSDEVASLLTEERLTVVDESRREGVIESNASTMIHRVVDLQSEDVAAIMTPRTDMVTIAAETSVNAALTELLENGFSRVPVIRDGIDDIVGILYARDLLAFAADRGRDEKQTVRDLARDVLYAPESQGIGDLLEAMRQQKVHMAIIVDEYSGVSGLVTLEDILEEIVGEISDEYDSEDNTLWKEHVDGRTVVDARFHLDDLNDEFGYGFPEDEEYDTIGGFILSCFGRIPTAGEEYFWKNLKLTVVEADARRLVKVQIEGETRTVHVDPPASASA